MAHRNIIIAIAAIGGVLSRAKEVPVNRDLRAQIYESGLVHEQIMELKQVSE
jgi:hypothetical protein